MSIILNPIGIVRTPYTDFAPFYQYENLDGDFYLEIRPEFADGLFRLDQFKYVYIVFYLDRSKDFKLTVEPPRGKGIKVGLFASRSPNRINPIGITTARVLKVEANRVYTSGLDILDNTPLLDIKPYIADVDIKSDANMGWIEP